jgi:hypothetical protein
MGELMTVPYRCSPQISQVISTLEGRRFIDRAVATWATGPAWRVTVVIPDALVDIAAVRGWPEAVTLLNDPQLGLGLYAAAEVGA